MGLDNYWLTPKKNEDNLQKFSIASVSFLTETPEYVEFENAKYDGEYHLNLVGGIFSGNGDGSFRGKFYSPLCDALLEEKNWLYDFKFKIDIEIAFETMKPFLDKFQSENAAQEWDAFINEHKNKITTYDYFGYFDEYDINDAIEFIKMFEFYSKVENICLSAWY